MKKTILLTLALLILTPLHAQVEPDSCLITSLPYVQDFDNCPNSIVGVDSVFVPCWQRLCDSMTSPSAGIQVKTLLATSNSANIPAKVITFNPGYTPGWFRSILLPGIDSTLLVTENLQLRLRFYCSYISPTYMILGAVTDIPDTITDPTDSTFFTLIDTIYVQRPETETSILYYDNAYEITIPLTGRLSPGSRLSLLLSQQSYNLTLDRVIIERTPEMCAAQHLRCIAIGTDGAALRWEGLTSTESSGNYTVKLYRHVDAGVFPPESACIATHTTSRNLTVFSNLSANTAYGAVVYATCLLDSASGLPAQWDYINFKTMEQQPSGIRPSVVVTDIDSTSITLGWVANGNDSYWDIRISQRENSGGYTSPVWVATNFIGNSYTLTGLNQGATYRLTVSPSSDSNASSTATASTLCPVYTPLPFFEDFDHFNYTCWDWFYGYSDYPATGWDRVSNHFLAFNYVSEYVVLPPMAEDVGSLVLSGEIGKGSMVVGVKPYSNPDTFIPVDTIWGSSPTTYPIVFTPFTVLFDSYSGDDGRIAIMCVEYNNNSHYNNVTMVDNLLVEANTSCHRPYQLSASATGTSSAIIHWNDIDQSMNYEIEYGRHGFAHGEGTTLGVFTDSIVLNGLHHSYNYDIYVRSHCGGDTSEWSGPAMFTTMCGAIDELPYVEDFSMWEPSTIFTRSLPACWKFIPQYIGTPKPQIEQYLDENMQTRNRLYSNRTNSSLLALPRIDRDRYRVQNLRVILTAYSDNNTAFFKVGVCPDTTAYNSFTLVETIHLTEEPTRYEVTFSNYTDSGEYITIAYNYGNRDIYINDIVVEPIPACQHPYNVTVSNVETTRALVSWHDRSSATQWQIVCGPQGFVPGEDTARVICFNATANPFQIHGLQPSTSYDVYVRSLCSTGTSTPPDTSEWTTAACRLYTQQLPAPIPYHCDFESTSEALQWQSASNRRVSWHYDIVDSMPVSHGYIFDTNTTRMLFPQEFHSILFRDFDFGPVPAAGFDSSLTLTVHARRAPATSPSGYTLTALLTDPSVPLAAFTTTAANTNSPFWLGSIDLDTAWTASTFELDTLHGIHRIVFQLTGTTQGMEPVPPVSIDDVSIETTPCPRPFNLHAQRTSETTADLTWYGPDSARYLVTWLIPSTASSPQSTYTDTATTNHFVLTGLLPPTLYKTKIQRICTDGHLTDPTNLQDIPPLYCNINSDTVAIDNNTACQTTLLPLSYYDNYTYSQQIYRAEELPGAGPINEISLNYTLNNSHPNHYVYLYLGHTTATSFPNYTSFVNPDSLQLVYAGPLPTGNGWNRIILPSVFDYDGERNLVLAVCNDLHTSKAQYYNANNYTDPTSIVFHGQNEIETSYNSLMQYSGNKNITVTRNQAVFGYCPDNYCPPVEILRPNLRYSRVTLRWHGDGNSQYEVHCYNTANFTSQFLSTADTFLTLDDVYPDYKYIYRVRKICDDNSLPNWRYGTFRTSPYDCAFPENLHITGLTHREVSFRWTTDENNTTYTLHIFNTAFDTTVTSIIAHATVSGLPAGMTFHAAVRAHCSPDNHPGDWSDTITFTTPVCPEVTDLTYSDLQGNSVVLDWQCDPDVTQWEVQFGPIGFTQGYGITSYTDHHPYTLTGLTGETDYDIYVRSVCDDDWFSEHWSNPVTVTTPYSSIADPGSASPFFTLSPNPATGSVSITVNSQFSIPNSQLSIVLRDATGRIRFSSFITTGTTEQPFSHTIPLHDYPAGIYFVTLVTPQGTTTRKLTIER